MKTRLRHRQLEAFHTLVEMGSAGAAAGYLHVTQPAISHLIRALESTVGFRLFQRRGRNLELTSDGALFYQEVDRSIQALAGVESYAEAIRMRRVGRLRIAVIPAYADGIAAKVVGGFLAKNPSVFVEMESFNMVGVVDAVESGRFDLGIVALVAEHPLLRAHRCLDSSAVCAVPKDHLLARGAAVALAELRGEPFIAITRGSPFRYEIDAVFQRVGLEPRVVAEARTQRAILRMVEAGAGLSIVDARIAEEFSGSGLAFLPTRPAIGWKICLITRKDRTVSSALGLLIEHIQASFSP